MLDRDLAELYGVKAIRLREQVKRNAERFPDNFMFQLSEEETKSMVSQNAIPSKQHPLGRNCIAIVCYLVFSNVVSLQAIQFNRFNHGYLVIICSTLHKGQVL